MESGLQTFNPTDDRMATKYRPDYGREDTTSNFHHNEESTSIFFPVVKQADVPRVLPRYTLALSRNREDGVGMEDLDEIQQDFEKLLSACAVRQRLLRSEVESINSVEEKKVKKGKDRPSVKRKRSEEKPKYKDARKEVKTTKTKPAPLNNYMNDLPKYEVPKTIKPKHDVSDQFWVSVNPFCREVEQKNVFFIEKLIKECSQDIGVKSPDMGKHFGTDWAEKSIQSEQKNGNLKPKKKVVKQILTVYDKYKSGEYTIQAGNGNRLRNGLCSDKQNGLKSEQADDEILLELKKIQYELSAVNKYNLSELSKLHSVVVRDLRRQDVKAVLDKVDNQVMNLYNKILLVKQNHAADMKTETAYEKYLLPKPNLMEFDQEANTIIKRQLVLHRELTDLTDFSLLE